jgi:hypothetical protein
MQIGGFITALLRFGGKIDFEKSQSFNIAAECAFNLLILTYFISSSEADRNIHQKDTTTTLFNYNHLVVKIEQQPAGEDKERTEELGTPESNRTVVGPCCEVRISTRETLIRSFYEGSHPQSTQNEDSAYK